MGRLVHEQVGAAFAVEIARPQQRARCWGRRLEYLDRHEQITVREYARMNKMPPWKASKALVMLARAGIVALQPREGGEDVFTVGLNGS